MSSDSDTPSSNQEKPKPQPPPVSQIRSQFKNSEESLKEADAKFKQGKFGEAEPLYLLALVLLERNFPEDHADVLSCMEKLGDTFYASEKFKDAAPVYRRLVGIREKTFGPHQLTISALFKLAKTHERLSQFDDAEEHYKKGEKLGEDTTGPLYANLLTAYAAMLKRTNRSASEVSRLEEKAKERKAKLAAAPKPASNAASAAAAAPPAGNGKAAPVAPTSSSKSERIESDLRKQSPTITGDFRAFSLEEDSALTLPKTSQPSSADKSSGARSSPAARTDDSSLGDADFLSDDSLTGSTASGGAGRGRVINADPRNSGTFEVPAEIESLAQNQASQSLTSAASLSQEPAPETADLGGPSYDASTFQEFEPQEREEEVATPDKSELDSIPSPDSSSPSTPPKPSLLNKAERSSLRAFAGEETGKISAEATSFLRKKLEEQQAAKAAEAAKPTPLPGAKTDQPPVPRGGLSSTSTNLNASPSGLSKAFLKNKAAGDDTESGTKPEAEEKTARPFSLEELNSIPTPSKGSGDKAPIVTPSGKSPASDSGSSGKSVAKTPKDFSITDLDAIKAPSASSTALPVMPAVEENESKVSDIKRPAMSATRTGLSAVDDKQAIGLEGNNKSRTVVASIIGVLLLVWVGYMAKVLFSGQAAPGVPGLPAYEGHNYFAADYRTRINFGEKGKGTMSLHNQNYPIIYTGYDSTPWADVAALTGAYDGSIWFTEAPGTLLGENGGVLYDQNSDSFKVIQEMWDLADAAQFYYQRHGRYPRHSLVDMPHLKDLNSKLTLKNVYSGEYYPPDIIDIPWPTDEAPGVPTDSTQLEQKWLAGQPWNRQAATTGAGIIHTAHLGYPKLDSSFFDYRVKGGQSIDDFFIQGCDQTGQIIKGLDGHVFMIVLRKGTNFTPATFPEDIASGNPDNDHPLKLVISSASRVSKVGIIVKYLGCLVLLLLAIVGLTQWGAIRQKLEELGAQTAGMSIKSMEDKKARDKEEEERQANIQ